jgi:hypothetical protein
MSAASRIHELRTVITEQNQALIEKKRNEAEIREVITKLYQSMVQFKPEFIATQTAVEDVEYPEMRGEDIARQSLSTLVSTSARAFFTVAAALKSNRNEVLAVYKELDAEIDDEVQKWKRMRAEEGAQKTAETFRANLTANNAKARPETPETPLGSTSPPRTTSNMPPTPPDSTYKEKPRQESAGKPKSPTTTFDKLSGADQKGAKAAPAKNVKK